MSNDNTGNGNEGGGGESKGPSKKELKKLAKKAEKDAAKAAAKRSGDERGGNAGADDETKTSTSASATATAATPKFLLANVPSHGPSDPCTLKACMASVLFSISLSDGGSRPDDLPFVRGPALLYGSDGGSSSCDGGGGPVLAFGGNGILKALALLAERARCRDHGNVDSAPVMSAAMDDWLEFERCRLRPALAAAASSGDAKALESALAVVEAALASRGGTSLCHGGGAMGTPTVADVAVSLTLLHGPGGSAADAVLSPAVRSYLQLVRDSPAYRRAVSLARRFAAPSPPPPLDPADPSLLHATSAVFAAAIHAAFPTALSLLDAKLIESFKCKDIKHGDYQCNAAMPLFQKLKASGALDRPDLAGVKSPQDVARKIIDAIPDDNPVIDELTVNGPGFIMSRVKKDFLEAWVEDVLARGAPCKPRLVGQTKQRPQSEEESKPEQQQQQQQEVVVVDFSSPNIAKEMHVGHLRSTIIGESVCRILEYLDKKVMRVNHVGDWGTQFGMLIQYLKEEYPDFQNGDGDGGMPNITDLTQFYKNAKQRFDDSPEFKKISQLNVVKLQAGDPECRRIWQVLCDVSRKEFEKVYDRLDITVEECGESFYNDKIPPVIDEFEKKGLIKVEDGGAKCVFVDKYKVPLMLQKSDGGYGYDSTDMAAIKYRLEDLKAKHIVYITDFTQGDHFQMVFAAARKIGWVKDGKRDDDNDVDGNDANDDAAASSHRLDHIGFGTVQGEDGKRFKTRSGDTVRLVDLLDEAVSRMETSLRERMTEGKANISEEELHATASAMGYGAVKYFDLRRNPTSNYIFSYDRMLDTKGNTAIYLLYAHARLESIIAKGKAEFQVDVDELISSKKTKVVLGHKSERNLGLHLQFFADCIEETWKDLYPYHICDFVYALSNAASEFVTQCKVLGSDEMESRLLLCRATTLTMRQCFHLLGIRHVMRI
ncbi:hypothetical protein ACHAXS_008895 [Conticribra weissflogii]